MWQLGGGVFTSDLQFYIKSMCAEYICSMLEPEVVPLECAFLFSYNSQNIFWLTGLGLFT